MLQNCFSTWLQSLSYNRDKIQKRFDFVIQPCHLAAYLFHPKYMGQQLSQTQVEQAKAWLISKSEDYLPAAIAFQAEAPPFPATFFTPAARIMNPVTWWKAVGAQCRDLPEGFTELIITLQSSVASSSSLERIFSTFGLVMTKRRNKLGLEKAQKLVFVYRMLRGPSELDYKSYIQCMDNNVKCSAAGSVNKLVLYYCLFNITI